MILIVLDLIVFLVILVGFLIFNFLIVVIMMILNVNDVSVFKVLYLFKKLLNKVFDWYCLLIGVLDMLFNGWIKVNNKIIVNNIKNIGFKNLLIYFKIFDGFFVKNYVIIKKMKLKINKYKVICFGDKNGENVILNDVVVSLGKVKNGLIIRYRVIVKI